MRLNTLQLIDPNECDMHWQKFVQHQNIGNYCFKFLETDISVACLILKQHASSIIPHLKEKTVLKVLDTIPQQVEPFGIIQWMRHYFALVSEVGKISIGNHSNKNFIRNFILNSFCCSFLLGLSGNYAVHRRLGD